MGTRLSIELMQKYATKKGGKFLSKRYLGSRVKHKWMCKEKHEWDAQPRAIINQNTWCPKCNTFYSEEICRITFEQLFKKKFPKLKPYWLINKEKNRMELDGYCQDLRIAFEYQGTQHYKIENLFTKNKLILKKRIQDDKLKYKICKKKGIKLFRINYQQNLNKLPEFIQKKSKVLGLNVKEINFKKNINFDKVYKSNKAIELLQKIAESKGGKCLSKKYLGIRTKIKWQCAKGHTWVTTAGHVKNAKTWCMKCFGIAPLTIQQLRKIAENKGGKCLSKRYINSNIKLKWQCAKGHIWMSTANTVKNINRWCAKCHGNLLLTIKEMKQIAKSRGGKCLSKKYFNSKTKLKWKCAKNHIWMATPLSVRYNKVWCQTCKKLDTN